MTVEPSAARALESQDAPCPHCAATGSVSRVPGGWYVCSSCRQSFESLEPVLDPDQRVKRSGGMGPIAACLAVLLGIPLVIALLFMLGTFLIWVMPFSHTPYFELLRKGAVYALWMLGISTLYGVLKAYHHTVWKGSNRWYYRL